jgi:hypothetical protein
VKAEPGPGPSGQDAALFNVQPCRRDPVCWLVRERLGLSPLQAGLLFLLVYLGGNFGCAWLDGNAFPRPGLAVPFLGDRVGLVVYGFLVPVGMFLAMRFYSQVESAFERIYAHGLILAPLAEYNAFLRQLHRRYNSPGLHWLGLVIGLAAFGVLTWQNELAPGRQWLNLDAGVAGVAQAVLGLIAWYSAAVVVLKIAVTARALHRVFDWPVNVQPLHPDGCGGFRLFTDIAVTIALFTAVLGLAVVLFVMAGAVLHGAPASPRAVGITVALEALAPLAFFSFLYRAHVAMREARERVLRRVHELFQVPFGELGQRLEQGELDGEVAEEIIRLNQLHDVIQRLPVWPTNTQILAQVLVSVAVPLGLLILQMVLQPLLERAAK